ncbi:MAG: CD1871A family CXXC motif-containing protein [Lachnospiraceae bacterium]|nr:CD1871A family CXXC motif-containing protein [Lachnospiraceae bacterium]
MKEQKIGRIRGMIVIAAVCFLFAGIFRGEAEVVWEKAVTICLECIGIG